MISLTLRSSSGRYRRLGQTFATPGTESSRSACERGSTTEKPFATTEYREPKRSSGAVDAIRDCSERCADASVRTYERLAGARRFSRERLRVEAASGPERRLGERRLVERDDDFHEVVPVLGRPGERRRARKGEQRNRGEEVRADADPSWYVRFRGVAACGRG